jgi:predicted RNA-binding protein YlxR (DUF448 family)
VPRKSVRPPKHVPQRTCVGCRVVLPKRSLVRLVRLPEGVKVDLTGKVSWRGAYLHNRISCWEKGLKGSLEHALKTTFTTDDLDYLYQFMLTLPEDEEQSGD